MVGVVGVAWVPEGVIDADPVLVGLVVGAVLVLAVAHVVNRLRGRGRER